MRINLTSLVLAVTAVLMGSSARLHASEEDGVALAIVYDTSGSMKDPVTDKAGKPSPKYVVANRALVSIARQIEAFTTNAAAGTPAVSAGLFIFNGEKAREAVPFGPFDSKALQGWATNFARPDGGTPLGNALKTAAQRVFDSPASRKHVLVITDGMNTLGPDPAAVLPGLFKQAESKQTGLSVHFVAFDVDAQVFAKAKKLGATVVGAADEAQLNAQLDFILKNEILLEKPASAKPN